jgi:hypothetical protein
MPSNKTWRSCSCRSAGEAFPLVLLSHHTSHLRSSHTGSARRNASSAPIRSGWPSLSATQGALYAASESLGCLYEAKNTIRYIKVRLVRPSQTFVISPLQHLVLEIRKLDVPLPPKSSRDEIQVLVACRTLSLFQPELVGLEHHRLVVDFADVALHAQV